MPRIVFLTGSELRHQFFRMYLAQYEGISVLATICEGLEKNLNARVAAQPDNILRTQHLAERDQSEREFFELFTRSVEDKSNPINIPRGELNSAETIAKIDSLNPDLIISFGCSIVRSPLLSKYAGRFINIHLGLSPYYRGSGTNFWPLVNKEPEFVGATFMHIDEGIDTGAVIHQIRAHISPGDTAHSIGNRLIMNAAETAAKIITSFDKLQSTQVAAKVENAKVYKKADFTEEAVKTLRENFQSGLIERYISEQDGRIAAAPIVENKGINGQN